MVDGLGDALKRELRPLLGEHLGEVRHGRRHRVDAAGRDRRPRAPAQHPHPIQLRVEEQRAVVVRALVYHAVRTAGDFAHCGGVRRRRPRRVHAHVVALVHKHRGTPQALWQCQRRSRERTGDELRVRAAGKRGLGDVEGKVEVARIVVHGAAATLPPHEGHLLALHRARIELAPGVLVLAHHDARRVLVQVAHGDIGRHAAEEVVLERKIPPRVQRMRHVHAGHCGVLRAPRGSAAQGGAQRPSGRQARGAAQHGASTSTPLRAALAQTALT